MSLSRFERELLASGKTSAPSAERRQAAKVAVMRAAGVAAAAATLTASSTAAGATATATATATSGVKALGLVKLVLLAVLAASAIVAVAIVTSRSSAPTAATVIAAPDVSVAMGQGATPSAALATPLDESPPAIASVPVGSLPNAPASASASASARAVRSPAASASGSPLREPTTEDDPLATEARILEAARACLARGDRTCAQTKLDEHEARFARGPLADEAALLAIDVALASGDRPKARRLARSLVARSPHGAWTARVKALAQEEDGPP